MPIHVWDTLGKMSEEEWRPRTVRGPPPSTMQGPEDGHCCGHVCVLWDFQSHIASGVGLPPLFFSSACLCSFCLTSLSTKQRTISILKHTPTRMHNAHLLLRWQLLKEWTLWRIKREPPMEGVGAVNCHESQPHGTFDYTGWSLTLCFSSLENYSEAKCTRIIQ